MVVLVNDTDFSGNELKYVSDCINSGWISSSGKYVKEFENRWAAYCGRNHCISVSNGTAALEVALASMDLPPGSEVIMPTFTIISCALAILRVGATPVLVDSDFDTLTMDVGQVKSKITNKTSAIMPVHIYGHPVDMDPIIDISTRFGLKIIEDAAEAHGAEYCGKKCGSFGDVSCFSFYANKIITTGEGGAVLTDDDQVANKIRNISNLYLKTGAERFFHDGLGFNSRLTNIQAAVGLSQIERVDEIVSKKISIGKMYTSLLADIRGVSPLKIKGQVKPVYWMYGIMIDDDVDLNGGELSAMLLKRGIHTRPFFLGMHEQPVFKKLGMFKGEKYPISEHASKKGLYLPSGVALDKNQIFEVCSVLEEVLYDFTK